MSEEEKRAIERLKERKDFFFYNGDVIILNLISNLQKENEELHKEINQRIKLKLENEKTADDLYNKIKILQKELEYKDDIIHDLGTEVLPISIEGFEVLLNKTKEENDKLQKELDKKDKVIDLMANQLSIASDRYEYMEETEIIEYFYKKVEK